MRWLFTRSKRHRAVRRVSLWGSVDLERTSSAAARTRFCGRSCSSGRPPDRRQRREEISDLSSRTRPPSFVFAWTKMGNKSPIMRRSIATLKITVERSLWYLIKEFFFNSKRIRLFTSHEDVSISCRRISGCWRNNNKRRKEGQRRRTRDSLKCLK